jgi:hypothetical protein
VKPLDYITQQLGWVEARLERLRPEVNNLEAERDQLISARIVIQRAAGAVAGDTDAPQPARRGRKPGSVNKPKDDGKLSTADMVLRVLDHMPAGGTAEEISKSLHVAGYTVRANHLGIALKRHLRGGRLTETDGRWAVIAESASNGDDSRARQTVSTQEQPSA